MDPLYGVLGMMIVIVVIAIALVRAPRRTHAWESGAPKRPGRTLREGRWRLREHTLEAIGKSSMVACVRGGRIAIRALGPNLEGAALVLDRALVDERVAAVLEDGGGSWEGEVAGRRITVSDPVAADEPDLASLRGWLERRELDRPIGEIVMISIPAIDYRVPFERPLLRSYLAVAIAQRASLEELEARNAQEREWATRAKEMSTSAAPAATADEGTLKDLEAYSRAADELTDRKDDPQAVIDAGVKRRFLLVQLAAFSLLDPAEQGLGDSLERRGYPLLAGLHRAACSLDRYLTSDERAELVGVAPVPVLGAPFSLDLFRRGALVIPPDLSPNRALAMAEAEMLVSPENGEGAFLYVKSGGYRYTYDFRIEDGLRRVLCSLTVARV